MTERRSPGAAAPSRYAIERTLGRGGMATVYLAHDELLDRRVALKVLAQHFAEDDAYRDRFVREARLAARLVHPSIVSVYDVGEDERGPFIVMEYVEGDTLADEARRRGRLPAPEVVAIGIQLCSALEAAHAEGLVHRDIKPQNVLRRPDGRVKLADFGIARSLTATRHTEAGTVLGTAAYLSPEQARGDPVTAAADIYSLGIVLYELLTGRLPFEADTLAELVLQRERGVVTPPTEIAADVPAALEDVIMRCLALRPEFRPASAAALAGELAASIDEPVTEPLPAATGTVATRVLATTAARPSRRRLIAALAAIGVLALGAILAVALTDSSSPRHAATRSPRRATTTATTTPTTTTTAATVRQAVPSTPATALAQARARVDSALAAGTLDPGAANDLNHRLDDIAGALAQGRSSDALHKTADAVQHLSDLLAHGGQIGSAAFAQIAASLNRLEALLPATQVAPPPGAHGKAKGHHKND